ncbi:Transcription factor verZ [Cladobotryum mycophilum]|uniref:Transcription factor verZ n=1 Tax=Cladobotryum mycophilum TaxID=491253 RepID=A0ABR0S7K3_9HYPO
MAGQEDSIRPTGRVPKYRTSCDHCQAAKVKCGHEKPSCRRCSTQKVQCVYSLSRRMGRPRAKKSASEDLSARKQSVTAPGINSSTKPKAASPAASAFADAEATIAVMPTPAGESGVSGSGQRPEPCTPIFGDFEHSHAGEIADDPSMHAMGGSLDFLSTDSPMELDDMTGYPTMPSFLDDLSSSLDTQAPISALSAGVFDPQDLLSAALPATNMDDAYASIAPQSSLHQPPSLDGREPCSCQHSRRDSTPASSNAAPLTQMFDLTSDLLFDLGRFSQDVSSGGSSSNASSSRHGEGSASPQTPPKASTNSAEQDSRSSSRRRASADQKRTNCNCISVILQRIVSLKIEQAKTCSIPIDSALMMESEVEESLCRLQRCKNCCLESTVYLLALVSVRMMLDLLQKTARDQFVSRPSRSNSNPSPVESGILCIGNFKVTPRARSRFLRKLLQARFHKLASLVEEREKLANGNKQDCFSKAASVLLGDISRGLRTIMGWIELWNAKHL